MVGLAVTALPVLHGADYTCYGFAFGPPQERVVYLSDYTALLPQTDALLASWSSGGEAIHLLVLDALRAEGSHPAPSPPPRGHGTPTTRVHGASRQAATPSTPLSPSRWSSRGGSARGTRGTSASRSCPQSVCSQSLLCTGGHCSSAWDTRSSTTRQTGGSAGCGEKSS